MERERSHHYIVVSLKWHSTYLTLRWFLNIVVYACVCVCGVLLKNDFLLGVSCLGSVASVLILKIELYEECI